MPKVLLLTYDVESRDPRRKAFEEAGFSVAIEEPAWPAALEAAKRTAPDVIAVDCGQLPSHGRETAEALRTHAASAGVPLVLFRVAEHDIERTRLKVPGGVVAFDYELLDRIRSAALTRLAHLAAQEPAAPPKAKPAPRPIAPVASPAPAAPAPARAPAEQPRRPATPLRTSGSGPRAARAPAHEPAPVRKAPTRPAAARSAKAPAAKAAAKKVAPRKKG